MTELQWSEASQETRVCMVHLIPGLKHVLAFTKRARALHEKSALLSFLLWFVFGTKGASQVVDLLRVQVISGVLANC